MEGRSIMGSSDFLYDLLEYLEKDNTDYLLITVDKGDKSDKVDLYYQAETAQSEQSIVYCFAKLVEQIKNGEGLESGELKQIDYGWVSQEELDEYLPPTQEDDEDDDEDKKD